MQKAMLCAACALVALAPFPARAQAPDQPLLRQQFFDQQRAYPLDRIPAGALEAARRHVLARWPAAFAAARAVPMAAAVETVWRGLGPAPIADRDAGRLSTIAIDPRDPSVIYVGGAQGGVWKTTNGGASWTPLTDDQCSLAMGSLLLDPADADIVYAGTGELHFSGDSYYGCGILRSTDAGQTWTRLGADAFDTNDGGARISKVLIDPASAGSTATARLLAASSFGLYRSVDGGASWSLRLQGAITDMVMHPTDPAILYAAVGFPQSNADNGVYRSTDGGVTWARLTGGLPTSNVGRIALAIAPSAPGTIYAAVQDAFGAGGNDGQLLGIWKTVDGAASWIRLQANNASCSSQCWYDLVIAVHPQNPDRVYFGGVSMYRSDNGGGSFFNILNGMHVDQHAIAFHPTNPETMFAGNDGGIYRSDNGGASWLTLNTNLAITQFYAGIGLHPTDERIVLGGTQDNGTLEYGGQPGWDQVLGGDGGFTAIDLSSPGTSYAETQWTANSGFAGPRRRAFGQTFYERKVSGIDVADRALFIPPLVMDPTSSEALYFGTYRLYRTADRADTWTTISPDLTGGGAISAIAPSPSSPGTIYVGTSDGRLQVTNDGGASWALRNSGLPNRYVTDIAVDAADAAIAIVTLSGFGGGHVFRTTNGGQLWQDISGDLPDVPVNAVLTHAALGGVIVIGTDIAMFRSRDNGASWEPFNAGFPNVAVFDLAFNSGTGNLIAATHGRGMFAIRLLSASAVTVAGSSAVLTFDAHGGEVALQASALDDAGQPVPDARITWTALTPFVATVTADGIVTSVGNGTTTIVAAWGGRADSVRVSVTQVVAAVTGMPDSSQYVRGERRALMATAVDRNGSPVLGAPLGWASSRPEVASVDAAGNVTALAAGEALIVASFSGSADSTRVLVLPPATLFLDVATLPGGPAPSSRRGTLIPVLGVHVRVDGAEDVRLVRLGLDVRGDDPAATLVLLEDVDGNGRADALDTRLSQIVRGLEPGSTERIRFTTNLLVAGDESISLLVAVEMSGQAPNGASFVATFLPAETRTLGVRSGAPDLIEQPASPVEVAAVRTTVLEADQLVTMSENPVRRASVRFQFAATPTVAGVYTLTGRRVADLVPRLDGDGLDWDLTNDEGSPIGPGVYLLVFEVDGHVMREKLMILR